SSDRRRLARSARAAALRIRVRPGECACRDQGDRASRHASRRRPWRRSRILRPAADCERPLRPAARKLLVNNAGFRASWDRITVYLPVILMGIIALGTYWLARNSPSLAPEQTRVKPTHDPDSFMRRFSVRSFDETGRLKSELHGTEGRHYPDTDTFEVD